MVSSCWQWASHTGNLTSRVVKPVILTMVKDNLLRSSTGFCSINSSVFNVFARLQCWKFRGNAGVISEQIISSNARPWDSKMYQNTLNERQESVKGRKPEGKASRGQYMYSLGSIETA